MQNKQDKKTKGLLKNPSPDLPRCEKVLLTYNPWGKQKEKKQGFGQKKKATWEKLGREGVQRTSRRNGDQMVWP